MGTLLKFVFCVVIVSTNMLTARSAVYSSPNIALKFSQCLVEKLSESIFFTPNDIKSITGVADVMHQATKSAGYDPRSPFSAKILLIAFVTSLADVIIIEDHSKNIFRKGVYAVSLEQCSMSTIGYIDSEFIKESLRIISTLEGSKVPKLQEGSSFGGAGFPAVGIYNPEIYPQPSAVFNPYAVIPAPVQSPFVQVDSNTNDKTIFGLPQNPRDFSPFSTTSNSGANTRFPVKSGSETQLAVSVDSSRSQVGGDSISSQSKSEIAQSEHDYTFGESFVAPSFGFRGINVPLPKQGSHTVNFPATAQTGLTAPFREQPVPQNGKNFRYPVQPASDREFSSGPDASSVESDSEIPEISESSDSSSLRETSQRTSSNLRGLKIPQIKESSIHVIPPIIQAQNVESAPSQDRRHFPQTSGTLYQPSTEISSPQKVSSFAMTSSASLPQTDEQGRNVQFNPTIESLISNILLNSTEFRDSFSSEINGKSAVSLARVITEQTLSGYNSDVIREALNAVSNAVATVRISSPENYALALSNALVSVLKLHNLPLFVDGSSIATSLLFNLGTTLPEPTETTGGQFKKDFTSNSNVQWEVKEPPIDFQTSEVAPEDTYGEIFSKALSQYLLNSDEMTNFFCSSDTLPNRLQIYFNIIKSSLSEFGLQIATLGAEVTSSILSELSKEDLCSHYGRAISTAIAGTLDENGLLLGANAEDISNRMVFSLNQHFTATAQTQKPEIAVDDVPVECTTNLPSETMPVLQSSFSSNFDQSDQETSALPEIYYPSSTYSSSSFEDMNYRTSSEPSVNYNIEPVSYSLPASFSPIEVSPAEELKQKHEIKIDYTSPLSSDVSDEGYSFSTTWMESLSSLSEPSATEKSAHYSADYIIPVISDDIIDQEKLASFLLEEIESSLDALNSKDSDQETTSSTPVHDTTETETETIPVTNNPRTNANGSQVKQSNNSRNLQQNRRRNKIKGTTPSLPDAAVAPSPQIQDSVVDDDITLPHHRVQGRSSRRHPESTARVEEEASSTSDSHSKVYNFQLPPEVLQPSFQARQSSESLSASSKVRPQVPLTRTYDFDYEDASFVFAKAVSRIAADSIAFIRSGHFDLRELCGRLNKLAPILRIPPLDVCEEIPAIDYLLHALRSVTKILKGV